MLPSVLSGYLMVSYSIIIEGLAKKQNHNRPTFRL